VEFEFERYILGGDPDGVVPFGCMGVVGAGVVGAGVIGLVGAGVMGFVGVGVVGVVPFGCFGCGSVVVVVDGVAPSVLSSYFS